MNTVLHYFNQLDADTKVAFTHGVRIVLILIAASILQRVASRLIRTFRQFMERRDPGQQSRIQTLGRVFRYIAAVVIWLLAGMLVLGELGISVAPVLATAGVAGLAIGFGAQSLVKDYFTGFFLLLEDQIRQGDVVDFGSQSGVVEEVTLRYVRLRNFDGHVFFVPNGEIKVVKNMTRDFAQAVIKVGIAYREEVDEAFEVMKQVGKEMRADPVFGPNLPADLPDGPHRLTVRPMPREGQAAPAAAPPAAGAGAAPPGGGGYGPPTVAFTSAAFTVRPSVRRTPCRAHCQTWVREISEVAASSIRL